VRFILVLLVFVLATTFAAEADDSYAASASSGVACSGDSQDPIANASTTTATQSTGNGITSDSYRRSNGNNLRNYH